MELIRCNIVVLTRVDSNVREAMRELDSSPENSYNIFDKIEHEEAYMITFIIGMLILIFGGFFYGIFVEKIFRPDANRKTPAVAMADGVDYVAMP